MSDYARRSFHSRTVAKSVGALIGALTRIDVQTNNCTGGTARPSRPPPWHFVYEGFTGTLPSIATARIAIQRFQFEVIVAGRTCRYGTATDSMTTAAQLSGSEVTNLVPVEGRNTMNLLEGPTPGELFGCPLTGRYGAAPEDGVVRLLNSTTRVRVTLI